MSLVATIKSNLALEALKRGRLHSLLIANIDIYSYAAVKVTTGNTRQGDFFCGLNKTSVLWTLEMP